MVELQAFSKFAAKINKKEQSCKSDAGFNWCWQNIACNSMFFSWYCATIIIFAPNLYLRIMKHTIVVLLVFIALAANAQFDKYFYNKTLRIDYMHAGTATTDVYALDEMMDEPFWGGSKTNLICPFDYGNYKFTVTDAETGTLIFSRGYSSLFSEWQTTAEARQTTRAYPENVVMPYPRKPVVVDFFKRNRDGAWEKQFSLNVDPKSYFIKKERKHEFPHFMVYESGKAEECLDIVFVPEGYTASEMEKFKKDCNRLADFLLNCKPFDEYKGKINIYAVEAPSAESGADIPGKDIWKKTILNSNFYTFDIERYLTTADMKSVRDVAANVPYDQICVIANSQVYGGGGIYNHYALFTSDNPFANYVFVHEFGHSFAGLGDEYYNSEVAYEDLYNLKAEPWEPNITTLVDFKSKWEEMLTAGTPVPTSPEDKDKYPVGVYEGGGYMAKGIYRPAHDCTMKSISYNNFCPVCQRAIRAMLDFYTE